MQTRSSRAGRRPLAITIATLLALTSLAACSGEPVAPKHRSTLEPKAAVRGLDFIDVWVTNTSGGTEPGSLRWAAEQLRDVDGSCSGSRGALAPDGLPRPPTAAASERPPSFLHKSPVAAGYRCADPRRSCGR